ncbi:MAG: hypothetical protein Q7S44_02455 [bacterium]|nr:hypothetical protein [bacterium]
MSSKILGKIEALDKKLEVVERVEERLEGLVEKEVKEIEEVEEEERKLEKSLLQVGKLTVKRSQLLELARGAAGAFLGVGLGQALGGSVDLAKLLPWINTLGILLFILILVGILIYKHDKDQIPSRTNGFIYIGQKLLTLYFIAILVQLLGLVLFNNFPGWNETLIKALIIGSYVAMSSAAAFTLI